MVELLDEVAARPLAEPRRRAAPVSQPAPEPEPAPDAALNPAPSMVGHVLLVPSPDGYRLREREEAPPGRGDSVEVEGETFSVIRLGPSPLPGDRRRCAYLERQEPPRVDRTFDR